MSVLGDLAARRLGEHRGEKHLSAPGPEPMMLDDRSGPFVIGAIGDHELHLVAIGEVVDVVDQVPTLLAAPGSLEVEDANRAGIADADVAGNASRGSRTDGPDEHDIRKTDTRALESVRGL